jgi:hypothetical protein
MQNIYRFAPMILRVFKNRRDAMLDISSIENHLDLNIWSKNLISSIKNETIKQQSDIEWLTDLLMEHVEHHKISIA